jgi:ferredoxin-NADP reductase/predicted pyridoxine 5'-phosphate oxidase superfamily flavin-nucleotide-binding protein
MQSQMGHGESPFHEGEQAVQSRVGVRAAIEPWARQVIRPYLPEQHREFYAQLPFVVAAARDAEARPWVTLLVGPPGFVRSADPRTLDFSTAPIRGDALEFSISAGAELGLLGIELETRRRNRVNGTIKELGASGIRFEVGQAFGNCPQYITQRSWREAEVDRSAVSASRRRELDDDTKVWIGSADTVFVGTGHRGADAANAAYGMDASHRGGPAGFVEVLSDTRLRFPDFAGNNHFNTIGNLVVDSRIGLAFVDFERGSLLQLTGKATIDWDSEAVEQHPGAQRLVIIDIEEIVRLDHVLPLRWSTRTESVQTLRVARKVVESEDVTSFEFIPHNGNVLPEFAAGQHLPIEFQIESQNVPIMRTYSLSNRQGQGRYRISVKREPLGLVSRYLHDHLNVGDVVKAGLPQGDFVLAGAARPVALISAGIGVTPMLSMLHAIAGEGARRPAYFIHGARDGAHHPFAEEIRALARANENIRLNVSYSQPRVEDIERANFDRKGRVSGDLIADLIPRLDADFYMCGPTPFLTEISGALAELGVDEKRIRIEMF